jgi:transglutaminase-like putative cysteine protease
MTRREFAWGAAAVAAMPMLGKSAVEAAAATFAPAPGPWRHFEITTLVNIKEPEGAVQAWIPIPSFAGQGWMRPGETTWRSGTGKVEAVADARSGAEMLHVTWAEGETAPSIEVVSRFSGRDRAVAVDKPDAAAALSPELYEHYTSATELLPINGIVGALALKITQGARTDAEKAFRIYDWVVVNSFRDPNTRGCGVGDIASMIKTDNLGGKCADLNALYVGLARAVGLPARDLYGIRVAPSQFGYKSLGAGSETITKSQHCRAEVWLDGKGWTPVDAADVRKVVLEEPPGDNALDSAVVLAARDKLFGAWEGNWLAYNDAHDLTLPGSEHKVGFLMYPQAEVAGALLDCLDPATFAYAITVAETTA